MESTLELSMLDESSAVVCMEIVEETTQSDSNDSANDSDPTDDSEPSASLSTEAPEQEEQQAKEEINALSEDDPIFDQVDALSDGIWVEFIGVDSEQPIRCKLPTRIRAIDKFIFVNR